MVYETIQELLVKGLFLTLLLSAPPVILATVIGITVSLIQALTQIQDQTLPFSGKLFAVILCLYFMGEWYSTELIGFAEDVLNALYHISN